MTHTASVTFRVTSMLGVPSRCSLPLLPTGPLQQGKEGSGQQHKQSLVGVKREAPRLMPCNQRGCQRLCSDVMMGPLGTSDRREAPEAQPTGCFWGRVVSWEARGQVPGQSSSLA